MTWPFPDGPDEATVTTAEVTSGQSPVLLVCHYLGDDGWAFLHGGPVSMDSTQLVALKSLVNSDPSLMSLADLPSGWSAIRAEVGGQWTRYEDPELCDEG